MKKINEYMYTDLDAVERYNVPVQIVADEGDDPDPYFVCTSPRGGAAAAEILAAALPRCYGEDFRAWLRRSGASLSAGASALCTVGLPRKYRFAVLDAESTDGATTLSLRIQCAGGWH